MAKEPRLEFLVLGPLAVRTTKGEVVDLRSHRQRAVLAVLISRVGQVVSADQLVDVVWHGEPPPSAYAALQVHMSGLRSVLEPARPPRSQGSVIATAGDGYRLRPEAVRVDASRYIEQVEAARAIRVAGQVRAAAEHLFEALSLWRGAAFADVVDLVNDDARWLDSHRLSSEDEWASWVIDAGIGGLHLLDLDRLARSEPFRDERQVAYLRALAVAGRRVDALNHLRDLSSLHRTELGLPPSDALVAVDAELRTAIPPASVDWHQRRSTDSTALLGREVDTAETLHAMQKHRLVTVVGPAGIGKSALVSAIALGFDAPHRVRFASLSEVTPTVDLLDAVAGELGVRPHALRSLDALVRKQLTNTLVVLDDHDRVADALRALVRDWLEHDPSIRIVTTGRRPLGLSGEHVVRLGPLAVAPEGASSAEIRSAPAVQLLARAEGVDTLSPVTLEAAARVCRDLGGNPLAIELVASWIPSLGLTSVADRLCELRLERRPSPGPGRHDSMDAAIDWSIDCLRSDARALLGIASVFRAPFVLGDLEGVAPATIDWPRPLSVVLSDLVEHSFVIATDHGETRWFGLPAPIRNHVWERFESSPWCEETRRRAVQHIAQLTGDAARRLPEGASLLAREELEHRLPDVRWTLSHLSEGDSVEDHLFFVGRLTYFWLFTGRLGEGRAVIEAALSRSVEPSVARLVALAGAAMLAWWQGDFAEVATRIKEAENIGLPDGLVATSILRASAAWVEGDLDSASRHVERAVALAGEGASDADSSAAMTIAGNIAWLRSDYGRALELFRNRASMAALTGNAFVRAMALGGEALMLSLLGRQSDALLRRELAEGEAYHLGDPLVVAQTLAYGGLIDLESDDRHAARERFRRAIRTAIGPFDLSALVVAVSGLAEVARREGDLERAVVLVTWVDTVRTSTAAPLTPNESARRSLILADASNLLGSDATDVARQLGRELTTAALPRAVGIDSGDEVIRLLGGEAIFV